SGFSMAVTALIMWWSCNAFIPVVAKGLAAQEASLLGLNAAGVEAMGQQWIKTATNSFNLGGLIGTLLTIPAAKLLGRKKMFLIYYIASAASLMGAFCLDIEPHSRLYFYFPIGLTVFGVFGSFTYYLPELFPTRLRGTGSGFTYNVGRLIAAAFPFVVSYLKSSGANLLSIMSYVAVIPAIGVLLVLSRVTVETRERNAMTE